MTQNFIQIEQKGNYFVVTTGWRDLLDRTVNYTGQFDFPTFKTSFMGYKNLNGEIIDNTGVAITCDSPYKRVNIRSQMRVEQPDGEIGLIDNSFSINGEEVTFEAFLSWLYFNTGTNASRTA